MYDIISKVNDDTSMVGHYGLNANGNSNDNELKYETDMYNLMAQRFETNNSNDTLNTLNDNDNDNVKTVCNINNANLGIPYSVLQKFKSENGIDFMDCVVLR